MQQFNAIFSEATSNIEQAYFRLSVHGANPVYRERVYCYELYHLQWVREINLRIVCSDISRSLAVSRTVKS